MILASKTDPYNGRVVDLPADADTTAFAESLKASLEAWKAEGARAGVELAGDVLQRHKRVSH